MPSSPRRASSSIRMIFRCGRCSASQVGRVLTRLLLGRNQRQELSRRDGASHLSLLVQRNLAQRKHTPPAPPLRRGPEGQDQQQKQKQRQSQRQRERQWHRSSPPVEAADAASPCF